MSIFEITTAGNAAASVAEAGGPRIRITSFRLDSSNAATSPAHTGPQGTTVYTGTCSYFSRYSSDTVQVVCEIPANAGPFNYGGVCLYLADGTMYARMAYTTIQSKGLSTSLGYAQVLRVRALLKLSQSVGAVFSFYTDSQNTIGDAPNFTYITSPSTSGTTPAYIVHETTPDGESIFIQKNTGNLWTPERYSLLRVDSVSAATSNTLTIATAGSLEATTVPGKYIVQTALGQLRAVTSVSAAGLMTIAQAFAPTPAAGDLIRVYRYNVGVDTAFATVDKLINLPSPTVSSATSISTREAMFPSSFAPTVSRDSSGNWALQRFFAVTTAANPTSVTTSGGLTTVVLPANVTLESITVGNQYVLKLSGSWRHALVTSTPTARTLVLNGDASAWVTTSTPVVVFQSDAAYLRNHAGDMAAHSAASDPHHVYVMPPGMILPCYDTMAPNGTVAAEGMLVSRSVYPELWNHVKKLYDAQVGCVVSDAAWLAGGLHVRTNWSLGDGSTNFRTPDLRGTVIRAWDNNRGADSGRALGSYQDDAIQNIVGQFGVSDHGNSGPYEGAFARNGALGVERVFSDQGSDNAAITFDASRVVRTAAETRVKSTALLMVVTVGRVNVVDTVGAVRPPGDVWQAPAPAPAPAPPGIAAPVANFTVAETSLPTYWAFTFDDTSTGSPTAWLWNFGDGAVSTVQNPRHAYSAAGTYTVMLTAYNAGGSNTKTAVGYITVTSVSGGDV